MILRLWLLVVLACVGAFAPSRACARTAETRTWDFFATATTARPESAPQVAETHQGFAVHGYELALGFPQAAERGRFVRSALPELRGTYLEGFDGPPRMRTFRKGERVYRSPNLRDGGLEEIDFPGPWFGTRATRTKLGTESQSYIKKWGNPLEELRVYEFAEDVTVYYGKVAHGKGYQLLLPRDVEAGKVLKFIQKWPLNGSPP